MLALDNWKNYFDRLGIVYKNIPTNSSAIQLSNIAGCPVFRVVDSVNELNELHTKARQKSNEMQRLLILALPLDHCQTQAHLPGAIVMPKVRVYGGHIADTFSISGHSIECQFLTEIKREVLAVISNGTKVKTPICDWVCKLLGDSWVYGTPSSLPQLDSMLGLLSSDLKAIGHVKARQLSFGRGCSEALLLPAKDVILKNNSLNQHVEISDLRFISLEAEMSQYSSARARIHPIYCDAYLSALHKINPTAAINAGYQAQIGVSVLGQSADKRKTIQATTGQTLASSMAKL